MIIVLYQFLIGKVKCNSVLNSVVDLVKMYQFLIGKVKSLFETKKRKKERQEQEKYQFLIGKVKYYTKENTG